MDDDNDRVDAVLTSISDWDKKISVLKLVREVTGLGTAEAKHFIENLPRTVKKDLSREEGDGLQSRFDQLGAFLHLEPSSRA
jgi:large subunit ribosomal protein L7/L12